MFIAHDLDLVRHFCDRVMVLNLGRMMETGCTADVFAQPRHPYARALKVAVPRIVADRTERPTTLLASELPGPLAPPSGCVFRTRCPHATSACPEAVPSLAGHGHAAACIRQYDL